MSRPLTIKYWEVSKKPRDPNWIQLNAYSATNKPVVEVVIDLSEPDTIWISKPNNADLKVSI